MSLRAGAASLKCELTKESRKNSFALYAAGELAQTAVDFRRLVDWFQCQNEDREDIGRGFPTAEPLEKKRARRHVWRHQTGVV
jgi:hypothetical protein